MAPAATDQVYLVVPWMLAPAAGTTKGWNCRRECIHGHVAVYGPCPGDVQGIDRPNSPVMQPIRERLCGIGQYARFQCHVLLQSQEGGRFADLHLVGSRHLSTAFQLNEGVLSFVMDAVAGVVRIGARGSAGVTVKVWTGVQLLQPAAVCTCMRQ